MVKSKTEININWLKTPVSTPIFAKRTHLGIKLNPNWSNLVKPSQTKYSICGGIKHMTNNLGGASHSVRAGGQTQAKHLIFSVRGGQEDCPPYQFGSIVCQRHNPNLWSFSKNRSSRREEAPIEFRFPILV
jgi:hypothetical protein